VLLRIGCLFVRLTLIQGKSGAIILYLVDQYDKDGKISYRTAPEKYLTEQWLAFQISGNLLSSFAIPFPLG
jgi:glutathione S-transferase